MLKSNFGCDLFLQFFKDKFKEILEIDFEKASENKEKTEKTNKSETAD